MCSKQPNATQRSTIKSEFQSFKKESDSTQKKTIKKPTLMSKQPVTFTIRRTVAATLKSNKITPAVIAKNTSKNIVKNTGKNASIATPKKLAQTSVGLKNPSSSTPPTSFQPIKNEQSRTYTKTQLGLASGNRRKESKESIPSADEINSVASTKADEDADEYSSDFESIYESDFEGYDESFSDLSQDTDQKDRVLQQTKINAIPSSVADSSPQRLPDMSIKSSTPVFRSVTSSALSRRQTDYFDFIPNVQTHSTKSPSMKTHVESATVPLVESTLSNQIVTTTISDTKLIKLNNFLKKSSKIERACQLSQIIRLQNVELSIYQQAPLEYSQFIRLYGKSNQRQACVQTNEKQNRAVQAEFNFQDKTVQETQAPNSESNQLRLSTDSLYDLQHFLLVAEQMLVSLLSPVLSATSSPDLGDLQLEFNHSDARVIANSKKELLEQAKLTHVHSTSDYVITVHEFIQQEQVLSNSAKSLIFFWSMDDRNHQRPLHYLRSWTHFSCLLYSSSSSLLIGATVSCQLEVFDLKKSFDLNSSLKIRSKHKPEFAENAALVTCMNADNGHLDEIVKLSLSSNGWTEGQGQTLFFFTVDRTGRMLNWKIRFVAAEQVKKSIEEEEDKKTEECQPFFFGDPSSRIRLQLMQTFDLIEHMPTADSKLLQVCSFEQIASHPDEYVIAFKNGDVVKCNNLSLGVQLTYFDPPFSRCSPITLQVHPTLDQLFAVLFEDSTIHVFSVNQSQPLQTLHLPLCNEIQWLVMPNAAVLCAISNQESLCLFDFCNDQSEKLLLKVNFESATFIQKMSSVFHGFTQHLVSLKESFFENISMSFKFKNLSNFFIRVRC